MQEIEIVLEKETNGEIEINLESEGKEIFPSLENLEVTPTKEQQVFNHENSYGYDKVTVNPIPEIKLQDKDITINENGTHSIVADEEYNGLNQVNVTVNAIENLTEELQTYNTELTEQETTIEDIVETLKTKGIGEVPKYAPRKISFYEYKGTELDEEIANLDITNITDMSYMFSGCQSLMTLDLSNFNTSNVTDMNHMFYQCGSLNVLNITNFITNKVTNMNNMFYYCDNLTSINLSNFNTSNVTNMSAMFQGCSKLTSINLSNFNTSNVTNMNSMFYGCGALTSLDLSNFDASNITDIGSMFNNCKNLTSIDLSNFNTSNVTRMNTLFAYCKALTSIDIRNFTFDKVTSYSNMFQNVPTNCLIIVKDDNAKTWITSKFTTLTNVKTVAEL